MKKGFHVFFVFVLIAMFTAIANAGQVTLQTGDDGQYINMPVTGTDSLVIPSGVTSFKVYDDGLGEDDEGHLGNYSNGVNGYLVLKAPVGNLLKITGSINTESGCDYLYVYDGGVGGDILLNGASGVYNLDELSSTYSFVTLYFYSDGSVINSGLELTISLVEASTQHAISLNSVSGGSISSDKSTAKVGETVTLSLTPGENNVSNGAMVVAEGGKSLPVSGGVWYAGNTATFVMPNSSVEVTPSFVGKDDAFINMPVSGIASIKIPAGVTSFKVYDDGGSDGNYGDDVRGYLVLQAPKGFSLMASGNVNTEQGYDYLTVYNGYMDEGSSCEQGCYKLIERANGANVSVGPVVSLGNVMTLYFYSDGGVSDNGIDLTVSVIDASTPHTVSVSDASGGSVSSDKETALVGELVTLTMTPDENKLISGVSVVDEDGKPVEVTGGKWYSGNTATFVMPVSNVTVNAVFAESITAESGAFINMPTFGTDTVVIPSGVTSFKVYDDGGKNGNHSDYTDGYLELSAPAGYSLAVSGTVNSSEGCGYVTVYDGISAYYQILDEKTGMGVSVGPAVSTENVMTIRFYSDYCSVQAGLDLTVTLVDKTAPHTITLNTAEAGTIASDKESAALGEEVTLTLTPNSGKFIGGVSVVDENGNAVKTSDVVWYANDNTVKFIMPYSNVVVTPIFVDLITAEGGAYVNMPVDGTMEITIPAGVASFNVYDDGGRNGDYSNEVHGSIVLTAPEGFSFLITGTVKVESCCDVMSIYEGTLDNYESLQQYREESADVSFASEMRTITLKFYSDGSSTRSGIDLKVSLVNYTTEHNIVVANVSGGTVTSDKASATIGETVSLNVDLSEDSWLNRVNVVDENGNDVAVEGGTWYTSNSATFTMPFADVTVTPDYATARSAEGGLYVNMPKDGKQYITIPDGVTSFKVYDDGGKDGNFSKGIEGILELTAPEGKILHVTGYERSYSDGKNWSGSLSIYEGDEDGSAYLEYWGNSEGAEIEPVSSIGNVLTLKFGTSNDGVAEGLDLTVSILDEPPALTITYSPSVGGTLDVQTSAQYRETVQMSAAPKQDYLLSRIDVYETEGHNSVAVRGGLWYSNNEASFVMPNKDVTVSPVFTNNFTAEGGLYVVMPTDGSRIDVNIPSRVTSFKIYRDDFDDYYGRGWIELRAPDGYVMQVSGLSDELASVFRAYGKNEYGDNCLWGYCGTDKEVVVSQTSSIELEYDSDDPSYNLDLTVTLIDATTPHEVKIAEGVTGGTVQSDKESAVVQEYVHLQATPEEGKILLSMDVIDSMENLVEVEGGLWYSGNQASFNMPAMYVTVSPTFTDNFNDLSINMPVEDQEIVAYIPANVTSFKVYDDGGASGEYTKSYGSNRLVMHAPEGFVFRVTGTVSTGSENDYLRIIDGDRSGDILLNGLSGYGKDVGTYYSSGRLMTLMFYTGSSGSPFDGLDLTVELVDASTEHTITLAQNSSKGTLTSDKTSAATGETVTLNAVPKEGYLLKEIRVTDANGNSKKVTGGTWATSNTATFMMPYSNVNAEAVFTDNWTSSVLYVNMPASGNMTVDIPEGVSSFLVYDDGGINASSALNANGHLVLRAPIGYTLQVLGSITGRYMGIASLSIHDGDSSASVITTVSSEFMGGTKNVATVTSSGNVMTLDFSCRTMMMGNGNPADMRLVVTLVAADAHEIALGEFAGGTASIDKATAYPGETVTLTTHSEMGYLLAGVNVEDAEHNTIKVSETTWDADNTATFTMPNASVTVTPNFTNDLTAAGGLYLRLPSGGASKTFTVPEGVTSFKLYAADIDEGLCSGKESSTNSIELSSSNGSNFLVEGTIAEDSWLQIGEKISDGEFAPMPVRQYIGYTSTDIGQYQSTSGTVTISYNRCQDLDLTVTVGGVATSYTVAIASATGGTVSSNKETAFAGERVGLSITPDNNHVIERLLADNPSIISSIKTAWYRSNDVYFTMPAADVTITPVFSDALTAEDGLFIDMPSGWNEVDATIPKNVKSFKIYDDGGSDGNYITPVNGELYMHAPDGYAFKLTGSMTASAGGRLVVEVGSNGDYTTHEIVSAGEGLATDVGTIMGDYMQLRFRGCDNDKECYSAQTYSGLDLTMSLVKSVHYAAVGVKEDEEGKMVATIDGNYDDYDDIDIPMEIPVDTVVLNRTFNHQTGYSTIVLPFNINGSRIDGLRQVVAFDGIGINEETGKKQVEMVRVWCQDDVAEECSTLLGDLQANTPYVIQMAGSSLVFHGAVTLQPTVEPVAKVGEWEFRGTLGRIEWYDGHEDLGKVYGFAAGSGEGVSPGQFVKAAPGAWIRALRAYIVKNPASYARGLGVAAKPAAVDASTPDKMEVVIVDRSTGSGEEQTTVIGHINTRTGEFTMERNYDLKGRKLNGKPTVRGMYYGKKKIVK